MSAAINNAVEIDEEVADARPKAFESFIPDSPDHAAMLLQKMLDEAGLTSYRYRWNPKDQCWDVIAIDCSMEGVWRQYELSLNARTVTVAGKNAIARDALVRHLANTLAPSSTTLENF